MEISASGYEGHTVVLTVEREGWIAMPLMVTMRVVELTICLYGSANEGDYVLRNSTLTFSEVYKSFERQHISVELVADEDDEERDEVFHILIDTPFGVQSKRRAVTCLIHNI